MRLERGEGLAQVERTEPRQSPLSGQVPRADLCPWPPTCLGRGQGLGVSCVKPILLPFLGNNTNPSPGREDGGWGCQGTSLRSVFISLGSAQWTEVPASCMQWYLGREEGLSRVSHPGSSCPTHVAGNSHSAFRALSGFRCPRICDSCRASDGSRDRTTGDLALLCFSHTSTQADRGRHATGHFVCNTYICFFFPHTFAFNGRGKKREILVANVSKDRGQRCPRPGLPLPSSRATLVSGQAAAQRMLPVSESR